MEPAWLSEHMFETMHGQENKLIEGVVCCIACRNCSARLGAATALGRQRGHAVPYTAGLLLAWWLVATLQRQGKAVSGAAARSCCLQGTLVVSAAGQSPVRLALRLNEPS